MKWNHYLGTVHRVRKLDESGSSAPQVQDIQMFGLILNIGAFVHACPSMQPQYRRVNPKVAVRRLTGKGSSLKKFARHNEPSQSHQSEHTGGSILRFQYQKCHFPEDRESVCL